VNILIHPIDFLFPPYSGTVLYQSMYQVSFLAGHTYLRVACFICNLAFLSLLQHLGRGACAWMKEQGPRALNMYGRQRDLAPIFQHDIFEFRFPLALAYMVYFLLVTGPRNPLYLDYISSKINKTNKTNKTPKLTNTNKPNFD